MRISPIFDDLPLTVKAAVWDGVSKYNDNQITMAYFQRLEYCRRRGENDPEMVAAYLTVMMIKDMDKTRWQCGLGWNMTTTPCCAAKVDILYSYEQFYN